MSDELSGAKAAEVRCLHFAEHWKVGTIATQLGMHHEVVERMLGMGKDAQAQPAVLDKGGSQGG